ncbi:MAG: DUF503 domain-containing protein [Phycisphaerales bacterium]|nr:DUF503 domain-containing protein [Phycisphaerales bacterium]
MVIGILQFELIMRGNESLKDKRRIVKGLKDRLHRNFMVSVAEIGALDEHRVALLGLVLATNSVSRANSVLDRIRDVLRTVPDAELGEVAKEVLAGWTPTEADEKDMVMDR